MDAYTVKRTCLNGWWDFLPGGTHTTDRVIPQYGWLEGQVLVPSFWTKPRHGVRKKGDVYYHTASDPAIFTEPDVEFLFDAFGYPPAWSLSRAGWVRRTFTITRIRPDRRTWIIIDAVMPKAHLYINQQRVCTHIHPTLPLEADITPYLRAGTNEIVLRMDDYDRDKKERALVPTGNLIPCDHSGVWQDVWLVEKGEISVSDVVIRTSTRERTLSTIHTITNHTDHACEVLLSPLIRHWQKDAMPETAGTVMALPQTKVSITAQSAQQVDITVAWPDAEWWSPENPKLYWLESTVLRDGQPIEKSYERFGFREVWIEGPDIMLNDHPVHLFSDWGHKSTPYYYTEGWIRQWFGMIRDANMNHSRLHTHPHPPIILDIADEVGILITGEAGLHGSGGEQGALSPAYWEAAADHVRRFVKRDKNHPSIILWSVENEMRWNTKGEDAAEENAMIRRELPKLRQLFAELDPTRTAYHDGDSSLWNEKTQPILSRHYGKETAGIGWWDRTQPLHSGEMALYHYAGPNNTLHMEGDRVYASFEAIDRVAAQDAALIIETGRTLGVSCFGPWNLSCLENLRMVKEDVRLHYSSFSDPGVKPLQVPAHSSEFTFWEDGQGYTPNHSFDIQKHAFRPLALIDRSLKSGYFTGQTFRRELFVVNDTAGDVKGTLTVSLQHNGGMIWSETHEMQVNRGTVAAETIDVNLPAQLAPGACTYNARFTVENTVLDSWVREIKMSPPPAGNKFLSLIHPGHLVVFGPGHLKPLLASVNIPYRTIDTLDPHTLVSAHLLIMGKNTVRPGSTQNHTVRDFAQRGGRVIVMEQMYSLFPQIPLEEKAVLKAFVRGYQHPLLEGLAEEDLAFWGDAPYPLLAGDTYVAKYMYRKDDGRLMLPILDSGEGGFGNGTLGYTPLFEAREGDGLVLACQMRVSDKFQDTPAATRLFENMLEWAIAYKPVRRMGAVEIPGNSMDKVHEAAKMAFEGQTVIVNNATPETLSLWSTELDVNLQPCEVGDVYQLVRVKDDPLLRGVSNEDTCGIETFSYTPASATNTIVGSTFITPGPQLEPLLVTPDESCLRELMVYEGRTEALRTHTLSRFLYDEKRLSAVGLGRVTVGKGTVLFNQFAPPDGMRTRFDRLRNRLLANTGITFTGSLLDGEATPDAQPSSPGYPQKIYVFNAACDTSLHRQFVDSTLPSLERMLSMPILTLASWSIVNSDKGEFSAEDLDLEKELYLYYPVWSPSARKNIETNLDVPNPEALTFLDMHGAGQVSVMINGHDYGTFDLGKDTVTVSDIALEMGGNHILLHWQPGTHEATLSMRWRNIMRQPEVGLTFGEGGSAN